MEHKYLTIAEVMAIVPGITRNHLAQLRFRRKGPPWYKPTPRIVLYREDEVEKWLADSARRPGETIF